MKAVAGGITWQTTALEGALGKVEFAAGHFVLAGTNGAWVGTGKTWQEFTITDADVNSLSVRGFGDHFLGSASNVCCFGESPSTNQYYRLRSADGESWTTEKRSSAVSLPVFDDGSLCIDATYGEILTGPDCDHLDKSATIRGYGRAALKADGFFLVAGDGGIFSSTDGDTWTQVLSDP